MANSKGWKLKDYYVKPCTVKLIIIWDMIRVGIPIFYFVITIIIYFRDDIASFLNSGIWSILSHILGNSVEKNRSNRDDDNDSSVLNSSSIIPSVTKAASNSNDELVSMSFLLGEIFRTFLICCMAVVAMCKKFDYMPTGTYFWTRSINSCFNVMSHLFQFLILGANIFRLAITTFSFMFDGYLSYIVYVFWQNLKETKNSSTSSSAQSDFSHQIDVECPDDQAKRLEEEIKAGLANDVLEVDEYDENGVPHTKAIRIDEDNKQVVVECILPPLKELNQYKSRDGSSRDNASRITAFLEDRQHPKTRKASYDNDMASSDYYRSKPSFKGTRKENFVFTSNHIQMINKSNQDLSEENKSRIHKNSGAASKLKLVSKHTGSERKWIAHDQEDKDQDDKNDSVSSVKEYAENEIYLDTHSRTSKIKKNL